MPSPPPLPPSLTSLRSRAKSWAGRSARRVAHRFGYTIERIDDPPLPLDFDADITALYRRVKPWTLTGPDRVVALRDAVRYVVQHDIRGSLVECGVWRGGSMLVVALTLLELGVTDRDLYLFDTFTEMPDPTERDVDIWDRRMSDLIDVARANPKLANTPKDEVVRLIESTGYPADRIHAVAGMVEDTVPEQAPAQIAVLRLDTDWYESTRHEMEHLYPRLVPAGVLIVDDYGQFVGCREAVDEYFAKTGDPVLLQRIDFTGRLVLKP